MLQCGHDNRCGHGQRCPDPPPVAAVRKRQKKGREAEASRPLSRTFRGPAFDQNLNDAPVKKRRPRLSYIELSVFELVTPFRTIGGFLSNRLMTPA